MVEHDAMVPHFVKCIGTSDGEFILWSLVIDSYRQSLILKTLTKDWNRGTGVSNCGLLCPMSQRFRRLHANDLWAWCGLSQEIHEHFSGLGTFRNYPTLVVCLQGYRQGAFIIAPMIIWMLNIPHGWAWCNGPTLRQLYWDVWMWVYPLESCNRLIPSNVNIENAH